MATLIRRHFRYWIGSTFIVDSW